MNATRDILISASAARACAESMLRGGQSGIEALFRGPDLKTGEVVAVHSPQRRVAYYLVGLMAPNGLIGFVRVGADGTVQAWGSFGGHPVSTVTLLTQDQALAAAQSRIHAAEGEQVLPPLYISDDASGHGEWLIEVWHKGHPQRWIFVTPDGIYERAVEGGPAQVPASR
jgi:hypothetical protein